MAHKSILHPTRWLRSSVVESPWLLKSQMKDTDGLIYSHRAVGTKNEPVRKTGFKNRSASHTFLELGRNLEGAHRMATQALPEPWQERGSLPRDAATCPAPLLSPPPCPPPGGLGLHPDVPSRSHVCPWRPSAHVHALFHLTVCPMLIPGSVSLSQQSWISSLVSAELLPVRHSRGFLI